MITVEFTEYNSFCALVKAVGAGRGQRTGGRAVNFGLSLMPWVSDVDVPAWVNQWGLLLFVDRQRQGDSVTSATCPRRGLCLATRRRSWEQWETTWGGMSIRERCQYLLPLVHMSQDAPVPPMTYRSVFW